MLLKTSECVDAIGDPTPVYEALRRGEIVTVELQSEELVQFRIMNGQIELGVDRLVSDHRKLRPIAHIRLEETEVLEGVWNACKNILSNADVEAKHRTIAARQGTLFEEPK